MPFLSKPSSAARTSIAYITIGALVDVWTIIYWVYLSRHPEAHSDTAYYWVFGFFFTGVVLLVIGLALGRIGRAARHAELPPETTNEPTAEVPAVATAAMPPGVVGANNAPVQYYTIPSPVPANAQQNGVPMAATPAVPVASAVASRQAR